MAVELISDFDMNKKISHLPGVVGAVRAKAAQGGAKAAAILAAHFHSGDSQIVVNHGAVDSFVQLNDERGQKAAAAIEYGRSGGRGGATQGIHALKRAF